MADIYTEDQLTTLDRIDAFLERRELDDAKRRLSMLSVAELRALAVHYFGPHCDADEMRKADLIAEIAPEYVADGRLV